MIEFEVFLRILLAIGLGALVGTGMGAQKVILIKGGEVR